VSLCCRWASLLPCTATPETGSGGRLFIAGYISLQPKKGHNLHRDDTTAAAIKNNYAAFQTASTKPCSYYDGYLLAAFTKVTRFAINLTAPAHWLLKVYPCDAATTLPPPRYDWVKPGCYCQYFEAVSGANRKPNWPTLEPPLSSRLLAAVAQWRNGDVDYGRCWNTF
jgi:hypothetical protein